MDERQKKFSLRSVAGAIQTRRSDAADVGKPKQFLFKITGHDQK